MHARQDCVPSVAPDHPSIHVSYRAAIKPRFRNKPAKRFMQILGMSPRGVYTVFRNSLVNVIRSLKERVYFVKNAHGQFVDPIRPLPGIFRTLGAELGLIVRFVLNGGRRLTKLSTFEFVESCAPHIQKAYRRVALQRNGRRCEKRHSKIKMFPKPEKAECYVKLFSSIVPRAVQPRDLPYNIDTGRFFRLIEKPIYRGIDSMFGGPTVIKGYNADDAGKIVAEAWNSIPDAVAIGLDANRFDEHVSVQALRFEHSVYLSMFFGPEKQWFRQLLSWQLHNSGVAYTDDNYKVGYSVEGRRMSGDMNTGLGNCVIMCSIIHRFVRIMHLQARLINNGDDCVLIVPRRDEERVRARLWQFIADYGFDCRLEPSAYLLEHIEFCQTHPVKVNGQYRMVRNITCLSKDAYVVIPPRENVELDKWRATVRAGGKALCDGVPIYYEFYDALGRGTKQKASWNTSNMHLSSLYYDSRGMYNKQTKISDETRFSFYLAFNIHPWRQIEIEQAYGASQVDVIKENYKTTPLYAGSRLAEWFDR